MASECFPPESRDPQSLPTLGGFPAAAARRPVPGEITSTTATGGAGGPLRPTNLVSAGALAREFAETMPAEIFCAQGPWHSELAAASGYERDPHMRALTFSSCELLQEVACESTFAMLDRELTEEGIDYVVPGPLVLFLATRETPTEFLAACASERELCVDDPGMICGMTETNLSGPCHSFVAACAMGADLRVLTELENLRRPSGPKIIADALTHAIRGGNREVVEFILANCEPLDSETAGEIWGEEVDKGPKSFYEKLEQTFLDWLAPKLVPLILDSGWYEGFLVCKSPAGGHTARAATLDEILRAMDDPTPGTIPHAVTPEARSGGRLLLYADELDGERPEKNELVVVRHAGEYEVVID